MTDFANLGSFPLPDRTDRPLFIAHGLDGSEQSLTHRAFDARCNAVAGGLLARGLVRGDRIGLLSLNRLDYLALVMGAMRAGIVPVPINPAFPAATIRYIVEDAGLSLVVLEEDNAPLLEGTTVDRLCFGAAFDALASAAPLHRAITPEPRETALILYTSGSTGRPKGVLLSHAAHRWVAETRVADYALEQERLLIAAPLYHMNALALAVLTCASRSTAVILPRFRARPYIEAIARYRCSWLTAVPPMIAMMLQETDLLARTDLSSVHTVRMGSAPVNEALEAETRSILPNARLINAYGTTEGGPVVFVDPPDGRPKPAGAAGVPHPEVEVRLGAAGACEGTLEIRSPGMMTGYTDPAKTAGALAADGFYNTGDVFRRDAEGFYHFVGRCDDMFVSGGENIYPIEVETVLESHADVLQSCVVPVPDAVKGTKPVAFVVQRPGAGLDEAALKAWTLAHGPAYQHPRRVWFLNKLPLGATNKIDRNRLKAEAAGRLAPATPEPQN